MASLSPHALASSAHIATSLPANVSHRNANVAPRSRTTPSLFVRADIDDPEFEARLERLRRKGASGTGKKAEERKAKASGEYDPTAPPPPSTTSSSSSSSRVEMLPALPLEEAVSGGLPVALGFSAYTERLNGRLAAIGLAALVAVELSSGTSVLEYHDGSTLGVQIYFLLAMGALYVKFEKEKSKVWPK